MTVFDPAEARRLAGRLGARATLSVFVSGTLGMGIGLALSPFISQGLPGTLAVHVPDWIWPVVLGALGVGQGIERGFQLRLEAQSILCQLQIEENTRPRNPVGSPSPVEASRTAE